LPTACFLQHPYVRDLAWAIANPPIIQGVRQSQNWTSAADWTRSYQHFQQQLNALNKNPSELVELLEQQHDHRLGHRFETLLTYWFKHSGRYNILAQSLQIQDASRTIGEFDFIVQDSVSQKVQHWEVSCKFYLGIKDTAQIHHWVGPLLKDRLDIKYKTMQTRQSQLSAHPAAQHQLTKLNINIDEHICLMKGRLFHPIGLSKDCLPELVSNSHQRGQWARPDSFWTHFKSSSLRWQPLEKDQWLAPQYYSSNNSYYSSKEILQYFADRPHSLPLCLAGFSTHKQAEQESKRVFLVAKDWAKNLNITDNTVNH